MKKEKNKTPKEKKINAKQQFKEALEYLKHSSNYIYFSISLFILSAIFGFINSNKLTFINKFLEEIISQTSGLNTLELTFFILQNNLQSALISLAGGILFGIFPIINAITNGIVIGYVMSKSYQIAGSAILLRLLPHGIFELPAIFISLGLGIKLGFSFFSKKGIRKEFKYRFYNSANVFLMIIIPLLIIAAIIEGLLIFLIE